MLIENVGPSVLRAAMDVPSMNTGNESTGIFAAICDPRGLGSGRCHSVRGSIRTFWLVLMLAAAGGVHAQSIEMVRTRLDPPASGTGAPGDNFGIAISASGNRAVIGAYGNVVLVPGVPNGVAQGSAYVYAQAEDGTWLQTQKLTAEPVGGDSDNFGAALSLSANTIAIGAPRRGVAGVKAVGSVFVYTSAGAAFSQIQQIVPQALAAEGRFGAAVALAGNYLAIGSPRAGDGRVDLYQRGVSGGFDLLRSYLAPAGEPGAAFGQALALSETQLLIGAPGASGGGAVYVSSFEEGSFTNAVRMALNPVADGSELGAAVTLDGEVGLVGLPGAGSGRVRVLVHSSGGWNDAGELSAPALPVGARFGQSLSLDSQRAIVGAPAAAGDGAAFFLARDGEQFAPSQAVDVADGGTVDRFGIAVANSADGALVGADLDTIYANSGQGSVYHFSPGVDGTLQLRARIDTGDGAYLDRFGSSVSLSGDIAMVGSFLEDTEAGADAGAVHWYEREGSRYVPRGRITAPDGTIEDRFGVAVDVDGERVAIGAFWDIINGNIDQGSVYVFRRSGDNWLLEQKLVASDGMARDLFGFALALEGDRLLVGARGAAASQGTAYVFRRVNGAWTQEVRLDPPAMAPGMFFGASVALSAGRAVIGAPGAVSDEDLFNAGAVHVYSPGDWQLQTILRAPQPRENAAFGFSVSADPQRILVGAFQDGENFTAVGAGYVYRAQDLGLDGTLQSLSAQPGELMGVSVAIDGKLAALGSFGYDVGALSGAGSVRLFERGATGWYESRQLLAMDAAPGDGFGRVVDVGGGSILIGAPQKARVNPQEGAAYLHPADQMFGDSFE